MKSVGPGLQPVDLSKHVDATVGAPLNQDDIADDRRVLAAAHDPHDCGDCDVPREFVTQCGAVQRPRLHDAAGHSTAGIPCFGAALVAPVAQVVLALMNDQSPADNVLLRTIKQGYDVVHDIDCGGLCPFGGDYVSQVAHVPRVIVRPAVRAAEGVEVTPSCLTAICFGRLERRNFVPIFLGFHGEPHHQ